MAQATQPHAHHPAAAASADVDVPVTAEAAVAVAERFNSALSSGDLATVEALLAADVLILESGGAEHSREEYMGHHAVSDAAFLKGAHRQLLRQRARTAGEFAWVGTESELHAQKDGKPLTVQRSEEHTSELQSLMRNSYAVFCLKKKRKKNKYTHIQHRPTQTIKNYDTKNKVD